MFGFLQHLAQGDKKPGGGVFGFLHDTGTGIINTGKNTADVVNAARQGTQGLFQASVGAVTHNQVAEQNAIQKTNRAVDYSLKASRGAVTPQEVQSGNIIKPIARNVAAIAPLVLPVGKVAEGASLPMKFLAKTAANAVVGGASTAASEQVNTGHINAGDVVKSTAIAGGLGALGAAPAAVHVIAGHTIPLNEVGAIGRIPPDALNQLAKANTEAEVRKVMEGSPTELIDKVAHAIAETKDPGVIDNILTRATTPKVDTAAPPPVIPQEVKPVEAAVKPDAEVGQKTLNDLAMQSKNADEFHQKIQELPQDPHVQAAFDKTNATDITDLYNKSKAGPFQQILDAVNGKPGSKGIEASRNEQNTLLSQERGQRFAASAEAGKSAPGSEGYFAEKSALKGKYSQVEFKPLVSDLGPARAEELFTQARQHILGTPDSVYRDIGLHPGGARLNTQTAVRKVLGLEPGLPTTSEIKLLKVYSPELADIAKNARPKLHQLMDFAAKVFGGVRSVKASTDFSMGGRQGIFVSARHPVEWAQANKESVKYAKSTKYYQDRMHVIENDPWVQLGTDNGLQLPGGELGHEEQYAASDFATGKTAKKLGVGHVIAGSARAYDGGLTELRGALFKSRMMQYGATPEEATANLGAKGVKGLTEAVNTLTGRGGKAGGFIDKHDVSLTATLFSPRLWASRLEPFNPAFWARIGPAGRAEAFQSLASFASVASLVLGAAAAAGATVETDPRSSDFLKIKVGDSRYDILGGFQQNLVFGWRELSGEKKSSTSGAVTKFAKGVPDLFKSNPDKVQTGIGVTNRLSIASDLAGNKLNPVLSSGAKLLRGTDNAGQPVNPYTEIGQLFVPISIQGTYQTIKDTGNIPEGILKNAPDLFGISAQTYGIKDLNVTSKQSEYIKQLQQKGAPADQVAATKLFFQTVKTVPPKTNIYGQIDRALKAGNQDEAIKIANDYNTQFSKAFTDWRKQYGKFSSDEVLQASYQKRLITDEELQSRIDKINQGG